MAQNGTYRKIGGIVYLLKPRDYVVNIAHTGVAGATAQNFIQIDAMSPFLLYDRYMEDTNDPTVATPGLGGQYGNFVQIQDNANNYNWSNDFVPRAGFARDRTEGYRLPEECLIEANTKLVVTTKEPTAGSAGGTSTIVLQGYSLYPAQ